MSKALRIGNLVAPIPVIQGGMGVGISLSNLAGTVAKEGGIGIISTAQIGFMKEDYDNHPKECNLQAIGEEIAKAKAIADGGIVGVNIMVATTDYELYVEAAVKAGADLIISGAGLPMNLPEHVKGTDTKIAPIVSSKKAISIIVRQWKKKYDRLPDLVVIEGPLAGGHLGFSKDELDTLTKESYDLEIQTIIDYVAEVSKENQTDIPVVVAGGVYDRKDMDHYMAMGAAGVQIGSRFVATYECDADEKYKEAYIRAKEEDIIIVKSPVGMPGRAIKNNFLTRVVDGERFLGKCRHCVKSCNPAITPYCISRALVQAAIGNVDEGLIFCGANVHRINEIVSVKSIMQEFNPNKEEIDICLLQ